MSMGIYLHHFFILFILVEFCYVQTVRNIQKGDCDKSIRTTRLVRSPRLTSSNRGKAITCTYSLLKHGSGDLVYELNFKSFHVGFPLNSTHCSHSYIQLVDQHHRQNTSGFFCGKLRDSKTFLAETDHIAVVFHSDSYNRQTYFRFQTSVLPKRLVMERHKQWQLTNPGQPVDNTYCDRLYLNCQGFCDVISPRFPGFYPRNVTCVNTVIFNHTKNSQVVIGGQFNDNFDVWTGTTPKCSDNYCTSNQITTTCLYDHIRVFDISPDNRRRVIQTFCGHGHLPRIISRGNHIQIEFVSAVAGSIAMEGFHLLVGSQTYQQHVTGNVMPVTGCHFVLDSVDRIQGQLQNLKHWYPPGTRCSYSFRGQTQQLVFLQFIRFNSQQKDSCHSRLAIYDSDVPDSDRLRGIYCRKRKPNETFLSTTENFYMEFDSKLGSYDGANFEYLILYSFIDTKTSGDVVKGSLCDEIFDSSEGAKKGSFDVFRNRLRLRVQHLTCTFQFRGRETEKVRISLSHLRLNPRRQCNAQEKLSCAQNKKPSTFDSVVIVNSQSVDCLCDPVHLPYVVTSLASHLELHVHLNNIATLAYRDIDMYLVKGEYEFLQVGCGQSDLIGAQGQLTFPNLPQSSLPAKVKCNWTFRVQPQKHFLIKIHQLFLYNNCTTDYLKVFTVEDDEEVDAEEIFCHDSTKVEIILKFKNENSSGKRFVVLELSSSSSSTKVHLLWSEISLRHEQCDFLCPEGVYCIAHQLVCNGVINCPSSTLSIWHPQDEGVDACTSISVILQWVLLTFCSTFVITILISASTLCYTYCNCLCSKTNEIIQV